MNETGSTPDLALCPLALVHQGHYICRVNHGENCIFSQWAHVRCVYSAGTSSLLLLFSLFYFISWHVMSFPSKSCHIRLQQQSVSRVSEWAAHHPSTSVPSSVWGWHSVPGVQCRGEPSCPVRVVPQYGAHETTQDTVTQGKCIYTVCSDWTAYLLCITMISEIKVFGLKLLKWTKALKARQEIYNHCAIIIKRIS